MHGRWSESARKKANDANQLFAAHAYILKVNGHILGITTQNHCYHGMKKPEEWARLTNTQVLREYQHFAPAYEDPVHPDYDILKVLAGNKCSVWAHLPRSR